MSTYFNDITEFDILPSKKIFTTSGLYIPEIPPFSLNFQNAGYESKLQLVNNRPFVTNISVYWLIIGLHSLLYLCTSKCKRMNGCNRKVSGKLYWNSGIRFYTETYMVCVLFAMLNYHELEWIDGITAVSLSNYISFTYLVLAIIMPIFFAVFYYRKREKWDTDEFKRKAGTLLNESKIDNPDEAYVPVIFMMCFYVRRIALAATLVYWKSFSRKSTS